jgi:hypothetical protein
MTDKNHSLRIENSLNTFHNQAGLNMTHLKSGTQLLPRCKMFVDNSPNQSQQLESLISVKQFWPGTRELVNQQRTQLSGKTVAQQNAARNCCHTLIEFAQ